MLTPENTNSLLLLCFTVLTVAHTAHGIRCYVQDPSQLVDCTAAGTCEQMSLPISAENGDEFDVPGVAYTSANPAQFYPPYPPILNMSAKYTTCYFALLTHVPSDSTSPPTAPSAIHFYESMLSSKSMAASPQQAPSPSKPPTASPQHGSTDQDWGPDYDLNVSDNDAPGVVVLQGGGTADPNDPFHNYAACMETFNTLKLEFMLMQPIVGGNNDLVYYCCTTTGCNYGPDGLNPGPVPPPHPKHQYRPRPPPLSSPAPIQSSPHDNHPTQPIESGSDGAIIGLRVFLAILLVVIVAGMVWFLCKQQKPAHGTGGDGKKPANSEAAGLLSGQVAMSSMRV